MEEWDRERLKERGMEKDSIKVSDWELTNSQFSSNKMDVSEMGKQRKATFELWHHFNNGVVEEMVGFMWNKVLWIDGFDACCWYF